MRHARILGFLTGALLLGGGFVLLLPAGHAEGPGLPPRPSYASQAEADAKSGGCLSCHTQTDSRSMHTADRARGTGVGLAVCKRLVEAQEFPVHSVVLWDVDEQRFLDACANGRCRREGVLVGTYPRNQAGPR